MADDFPYKAEYAKSGRSSCKGCRSPIDQGTLRLAVMVQSSNFDGKVPYWFHTDCFFKKHKPKALGDIAKYDGLRYEDQQQIKAALGMSNGTPQSAAKGKDKKAAKRPKAEKSKGGPKAGDFKVEYSASSRAVCIGCEQKIMKDEIRCAKMDYESEKAVRFGGIPRWYHVDCFAQCRPDTEFWECGDTLPGFKLLSKEDMTIVKDKLPKMAPVKKEEDGPGPSKRSKFDEGAYKKQMTNIFKLRDKLETLSKTDLQALLDKNNQQVPPGKDRILDLLSDIMTFGALEKCPECKDGLLYYRNSGYHCGGANEWAKCDYSTQEPARKVFKVPTKLKEIDFLNTYKCKVGKRIFENLERSDQVSGDRPTTVKSTIKVNRPLPPLSYMNFAVQGALDKSLEEIKKTVGRLGGKVVTKVDESTIAVISDQQSVDKCTTSKIKEAKALGIQVIPVSFLDAVQEEKDKPLALITKLAISSWGDDPSDRLKKVEEVETLKSQQQALKSGKSSYLKSDAETKVKVQLKNGAYVDPDSGLDKKAHVFKRGKDLYTAVLSKADVQLGTNSYYKIQVLQSDKGNKFWVFRAWGRIGTTIGKNKLDQFNDEEDAIDNFCEVFENQTGNPWHKRGQFKKQPGKYFLMDIDYGGDEKQKLVELEKSGLKSSLQPPVQDLIKMIFDVKAMEETMLEFELDLQKMPLGKLSQNQIKEAFTELSKLQDIVHSNQKPNKTQIVSFSNRFYTLIPHSAGLEKLPMLDNEEIIKTKLDMLESLMEMEVAYSMMKVEGDKVSDKVHPVDQQYAKLKTNITVLERDSEEFGHLLAYVKNTHAETHGNYELDILEVFKVERQGEKTRFKPFKGLPNRKLLWHGSRTTNYAGILSQGLRIAPPEAPVTGYMFGKGIYFADMVSKSANYCYTSKKNNTGLLLLCDVALGHMVEHTRAEYVEKLPKGKHSVKGVGRTHPDPEQSVKLPHGVEIPLGKPKSADTTNTSLLYNEYIVYDQSQVKIEYLLKLNFNYKY